MITDKLFVPGSILWLARHQVRLSWRLGRMGKRLPGWMKPIFTLGFVGLLSVAMGYNVAEILRESGDDLAGIQTTAGAIVLTLVMSGISMNLMGSFMTMTEKGDLDLLLSSPLPPHRFVAARLMAATWRSFCIYTGFAIIFFAASIVTVSPMFASIFVVVAGIALFDSAITYLIARQALLWFGLRKGRMVTVGLGAMGVISGLLGYQMITASGSLGRLAEHDRDPSSLLNHFHDSVVGFTSNFGWLGSTVLGNWLGALVILGIGVASFILVLAYVGQRFDHDVAALNGQSDHGPKRAAKVSAKRFRRSPVMMVFHKEWLSLIRDPLFFSQLVVPLFTMVPFIGFIWTAIQHPEDQAEMGPVLGSVFAGITVFNVTMLTSSLAWLVASVEEARDLLQASPMEPRVIIQGKILAASAPAIIELILITILTTWTWPHAAVSVFVMGMAACAGACMVEFSRPRPTKRPKMTQRPDRSLIVVLYVLAIGLLWAVAAGLAAAAQLWWILPAVGALTMSYLAWATRPRDLSSIPVHQPLVADAVGLPGGPWRTEPDPS